MISIEWNKSNLDSFYKKMDNIIKSLPKNAENGVKKALEETRDEALRIRGHKQDKELMPIELETSNNLVEGRLHTDKNKFSSASFEEYGTGTFAERDHIGVTKTFINSGYRYWYAPADQMNRDYGAERTIIIDGKKFYVMYPQRPKAFMRTASFTMRKQNVEEVKKALQEGIKEAIK